MQACRIQTDSNNATSSVVLCKSVFQIWFKELSSGKIKEVPDTLRKNTENISRILVCSTVTPFCLQLSEL